MSSGAFCRSPSIVTTMSPSTRPVGPPVPMRVSSERTGVPSSVTVPGPGSTVPTRSTMTDAAAQKIVNAVRGGK